MNNQTGFTMGEGDNRTFSSEAAQESFESLNSLFQKFPDFGKQLKELAAICNQNPEVAQKIMGTLGKYTGQLVKAYAKYLVREVENSYHR